MRFKFFINQKMQSALKVLCIFIVTILFSYSCINQQNPRKQVQLSQNWQFKAIDDSTWLKAKVPGVVHLDLLKNKIIPNPFDSTNEQFLQWIGEKDWEYQLKFNADTLPNYKNTNLVFTGLDTYADVYLNDSLLLQADNMYRTWRISVKKHLQKGENTLKIIFKAPEKINQTKAQKLPYKLPDERGFSRKAPYQFGWDWGAKFLTAGICKPVYLDFWDNAKISDIHIIQGKVDTVKAEITAIINIVSSVNENYLIKIFSNDSLLTEKDLQLEKGTKQYLINFNIKNPQLWWCNGMGEPNLYNLKFELIQNNTLVDSKTETIGLRTIELVQEPDSIGKSFYFKLNGKPIFAKGANWVPADNFLPRLTKQDYKRLINEAIWANFNMLRVWGGGIYENDEFYNLCDQNGVMVWQDFMFACNMYPGDTNFINSVKHEAIDNIIRLRNRPSLALWCGNNEIDNGWKDWGWQKQFGYTKQDSTEIWNNYLKIFENLLPNLIEKYDGTRNYHPSSPTYGWGHNENFTHGDSHYWGVWWGHEPFEVFNKKVGRFMSEYGFQALPNIKSIKQFTPENQLYINSSSMKTHQKHPVGYETINEYLQQYYNPTKEFENYIYLSQLTQAKGITTAIEAHRRAKPICMGTLYWQFNDAWPVTSWSGIDYYAHRKALQYFVKQAYKPTIISTIEENDSINIYVISDKQETQNLLLKIYQKDFFGKTLHSDSVNFNIKNNSKLVYKIANNKNKQSFIYTELYKDEKLLDENFYYFIKPKYLQLPKAKIDISYKRETDYTTIILQSDVLSKNLELISNLDGKFSDNYFDLLPKVKKEIIFKTKENGKLNIKYRCLNNIYK